MNYTVEEYIEDTLFEAQQRLCKSWAPVDSNVEEVRQMLRERMHRGLNKYGVNTDRTDLSTEEWIQHAIEEALDLAVYLTRLKKELKPRSI